MSAGSFVIAAYVASYALETVHPIRVQPETIAAQPVVPDAAPTSPISAHVSGSKRSIGLIPRKVTLRDDILAPPDGYEPSGRLTIPILDPDAWNGITKGSSLNYLGIDMVVVSKSPEYVN